MYSTSDVSQPMKSMVPDEDAMQGQRFSYLWHSKYMYLNNRKKKLKKTWQHYLGTSWFLALGAVKEHTG